MPLIRRLSPTLDGGPVALGGGESHITIPEGEYTTPFWVRFASGAVYRVDSLPWRVHAAESTIEILSESPVSAVGRDAGVAWDCRAAVGRSASADWNVAIEAPAVDPFFEDDFATGSLGSASGGFSWVGSASPSFGTHEYEVVEDVTYPGDDHSLAFLYASGDSGNDLYFGISPGAAELWLEYYLRIPSNYSHPTALPNNNKLWSLFGGDYNDNDAEPEFTMEYTPVGGSPATSAQPRCSVYHGDVWIGGVQGSEGHNVRATMWTSDDHGEWVRIRIHARVASDGRLSMWRDDTIVYDKEGASFTTGGPNNLMDAGYLMGSANAHFSSDTYFHVARFKIWREEPSWFNGMSYTP